LYKPTQRYEKFKSLYLFYVINNGFGNNAG
jgi:hypothetical protein